MPRLPRKVPRRHRRPAATKRATQCHKCHACHAKRRWMSPCATPATQNQGRCLQVPRLPRKTKVDVSKCHACHACHAKCRGVTGDQRRPSTPRSAILVIMSATPATQNQGRCLLVPRLPRKPKVNVSKCHACHAKCRGVTGDQRRPSAPRSAISATPATQNQGGCEIVPRLPRETKVDVSKCHACHAKRRWMSASATPATQSAAASPATNGDQARHAVP